MGNGTVNESYKIMVAALNQSRSGVISKFNMKLLLIAVNFHGNSSRLQKSFLNNN